MVFLAHSFMFVPLPPDHYAARRIDLQVHSMQVKFELIVKALHGRYLNELIIGVLVSQSYFNKSIMSWYSTHSDATRKLQILIDSQPTLQQLLEYPDFLELLKAYQPKLLEYITNSSNIPRDIIKYITEPPAENDSDVRKYKLPLMTMLMVETDTICVINSFFRVDTTSQRTFFISSFFQFLGGTGEEELLPLLCGYFSQLNLILWNKRYKETIDLIYEAQQPLLLLTKHTYSKAIVNTLLLYLNLDLTRNANAPPERQNLKLQVLRLLYDQLKICLQGWRSQRGDGRYQTIVQNIGEVLVEIIQKYYLIADGKSMLQVITSAENVALVMQMFMQGGTLGVATANIVGWLMRYYCLSSFNAEDPQNIELNKRNQQRLQSQPFPKMVLELIPKVTEILANAVPFTLFHSRLLQIFNMTVELCSRRVVQAVKKARYIQLLVSLLFKFPQLSILHKMVEKLFYLLFNSDRSVSQEYRKYLFCEVGLIEITVGAFLAKAGDLGQFRATISSCHEGYFSYLMRIIKIYSKIQTNDEEINRSIMQRSALWQQFSQFVLQPYEALCFKDLGSYDSPEKPPVEYSINNMTRGITQQQVSKKVLEEINQEESMQKFKIQQGDRPQEESKSSGEDAFFQVQDLNGPERPKEFQADIAMPKYVSPDSFEHQLAPNPSLHIQIPAPKTIISHIVPPETPPLEQPKKLAEPEPINRKYEEFLSVKKQQVDKQLKMQRTNSSEKRLSANKSRVTSPSPKKKRWDDTGSQEEEKPTVKLMPAPAPLIKQSESDNKKQKISLTTPSTRPPMVPHKIIIPAQPTNQSSSPKPQAKSESKRQSIKQQLLPSDNFSQLDSVNTSINSLPDLKISEMNSPRESEDSKSVFGAKSTGLLTSPQLVYLTNLEESRKLSKSAVNLSDLKNVQFRRERVLKPQKTEYRKIEAKDRIFLDFLGVKY